MIYIVGSGLTGIAAATALIRRGCRPTILDPGLLPEPSAQKLKSQLAAVAPGEWEEGNLSLARQLGPVATNGIPRKLYFGSDFTFRQISLVPALDQIQSSTYRSFAAGGFSNVWGAVIEPLPPEEFRRWPISFEEMAPHYAAVRRLLCDPPGGAHQMESPSAGELHSSSQTRAMYADLWAARKELEQAGILFNYPQLAVRAAKQNGDGGCCYCNLCLHGCPYDSKYTAVATLRQLIREGRVEYISGVVVDKVMPENGHIRVTARSVPGGAALSFRGERVYLSAGFLETSRIILNSLNLHGIPFRIKHSDIFTLPVVRYRTNPGVVHEKLHTLCQLVAHVNDEKICPHPVHLQFYGYNDLYAGIVAQKMGLRAFPFKRLLHLLTTRLFVVFGYLHSSVSSHITLTLAKDPNPLLQLEGQPNEEALKISRAVARKLFRNRRHFHAIPIESQLRLDLPGGGYHSGGVFPMRNEPGAFETDRLGMIASLPGVHIVDTAVLPEIPPLPTAFTAMANAHRIASSLEVLHGK